MMAPEMAGAAIPQREAGRSDPKIDLLGGVVFSENNPNSGDWQMLGDAAASVVADLAARRAAWLIRCYRVRPSQAALIADIAFTTTGRRY